MVQSQVYKVVTYRGFCAIELAAVCGYLPRMLTRSMTRLRARVRALLLLVVLAQPAFLAHLVTVEHDESVSCEVCLKAQQSEDFAAVSGVTQPTFLPLVFVGCAFLIAGIPSARPLRLFSSRAPPPN